MPARPRDPFSEKALTETFVELYRRAATNMPPDVLEAVEKAIPREEPDSVGTGRAPWARRRRSSSGKSRT